MQEDFERAETVRAQVEELEQGVLNTLNYELEDLRLDKRRAELDNRPDRIPEIDAAVASIRTEYAREEARLRELYRALEGDYLTLATATDEELEVPLADILRAWQPNDMSTVAKLGHYSNKRLALPHRRTPEKPIPKEAFFRRSLAPC